MNQSSHPSGSKHPPRQPRKGLTSTGARKAASKSSRSRSREFALQGLYQLLVGKNDLADIDSFTRDLAGFSKADALHFETLLHGCFEQASQLDEQIEPLLDRPLAELSPIERACMWIGSYEFSHCPEIPWRVVLNECIELTKEFGGSDGHKYVNAVLNALVQQLRSTEIQAEQANPARKPH